MRNSQQQISWAEWLSDGGLDEMADSFGYDPRGCGKCKYGILSEPDTSSVAAPLYLRRAIAASMGLVLFCDCDAGRAQERYMEKILKRIPAYMLRKQNKGTMVTKREQGYYWTAGSAPLAYVSSNIVQAVYDAIEAVPSIHTGG